MFNLGNYKDVLSSINEIKKALKVSDKQIADWIWDLFSGTEIQYSPSQQELDARTVNDVGSFIENITALLFGVEVSRNLACLIIHPMMLDLIRHNSLSWQDALTGMASMPMASENAVAASRGLRIAYKKYLSLGYRSYSYDYAKNEVLDVTQPEVLCLATKEHEIVNNWLKYIPSADRKLSKKVPTETAIGAICVAIDRWYAIKIQENFKRQE
ncbi:unnamed protein product [Didymodactylos carnosus]|uniref:Uncharacterized protein n=1 Tax=Didymodactylos carnosus TaxID=1234261 RepID=A0A815YF11_9BILA|nr:unnamed protein product [Didymodactylos carnosus]CAF1568952.1 unnamed protein product [Didymodactylos carnosus]CAF3717923.1 unnamed protein product [Didymodactylos carnosus]CAF4431672.1 unnamed protein product [Didymodactylos carnosus]